MEEVMARGPNFVYAKEFILKKYGEVVWETVLDRLPEDVAKIWAGTLFNLGEYPFTAFKALTLALSKELGTPTDSELAKMYEYIADRSLHVLYKIFFKITSPSFVISNYPKLWGRFFITGSVEVPLVTKGQARVKFILPEIFLDWLPPACLGYSKKAVEMAGGTSLQMEQLSKTSLPNDDVWEILYELKWDE